MKRLKIVNKKRFIIVVTILVLLVATILCSLKTQPIKTYEIEEYTVVNGDTLWSIGSKYCDNQTDIREWIYNVRKLNNINCIIYEGQTLQVLK